MYMPGLLENIAETWDLTSWQRVWADLDEAWDWTLSTYGEFWGSWGHEYILFGDFYYNGQFWESGMDWMILD